MVKEILEGLASIGFHVVIFLAGVVLLYVAVFEGIPSADNSWQFIPRSNPLTTLLWAGCLTVATSFAMFMIGDGDYSGFLFPSKAIRREHSLLSGTQKDLMREFYMLHRSELSFDDFYEFLQKKGENKEITGMAKDEVLYRLKDLYRVRLIGMQSKGPKSTILKVKSRVARVMDYPT